MNILEYIEQLMAEGFSEEEAYLMADEAFFLDSIYNSEPEEVPSYF